MEYLVILFLLIAFFIGKGIYDNLNYKKKIILKLKNEFGTVSDEEYTDEKLKSLKAYYMAVKRDANDIDDITWNDLELDEVFFLLNRTQSAVGEEYLYAALHMPQFSEEELSERERIISFLEKNEDARLKLQKALYSIGKSKRYSVYSCMEFMKTLKRESNAKHFLCIAAILASIAVLIINSPIGVFSLVVSIIANFLTYFKRKSEMEAYLNTVTTLVRLLYCCEELTKCDIPELSEYSGKMKQLLVHFSGFRKNYWLLGSRRPTGDLLDTIMMYVRMLLHLDLIKFNHMLKIYDKYNSELLFLYETAGYLDSMSAIASFRKLFPDHCVPVLVMSKTPCLKAEALYHPLISVPVKNSIDADQSVLLTGSNASGKSTFLKAVAINAVLAQTIHTVMADSYQQSYFQILSSMALRDNLQGQESYFIVEIKTLKRMLKAKQEAKEGVSTLCFVDEVLRGTNTVERIAASKEVLISLAGDKTLVFAATHDNELTYLCEKSFDNYHFEETVTDSSVDFDYCLKKGRATTRNAIKLLSLLGYPKEIIDRAESSAEEFLKTGIWK